MQKINKKPKRGKKLLIFLIILLSILLIIFSYNNLIKKENESTGRTIQEFQANKNIIEGFQRGDINKDRMISKEDLESLKSYMLQKGAPPSPIELGDVNCDETINTDYFALADVNNDNKIDQFDKTAKVKALTAEFTLWRTQCWLKYRSCADVNNDNRINQLDYSHKQKNRQIDYTKWLNIYWKPELI